MVVAAGNRLAMMSAWVEVEEIRNAAMIPAWAELVGRVKKAVTIPA